MLARLGAPALRRSPRANLLAKPPERERERVRQTDGQALDDATDERDGKQRLAVLGGEVDRAGYTATAERLADDLRRAVVHLRHPTRHAAGGAAETCSNAARRGRTTHQGNRPLPRRDQLPHLGLGRP